MIKAHYYCKRCGELFWDSLAQEFLYDADKYEGEPLGHDWREWIITKDPTEKAEGLEARTCSRCEETETRVIPKLAHTHSLTAIPAVPATCETAGTEAYWKCASCGKFFNDPEGNHELIEPAELPALGHNWGNWIVTKDPTEKAEGLEERTCLRCEETESRVIPKLAHTHSLTSIPAVPATCETAGTEAYWKCASCGKFFNDPQGNHELKEPAKLPALGHNWGNWTITKPATVTEEGTRQRICANDPSHIEMEAVPKLDPRQPENPFTDVSDGAYYYKAVLWAVNNAPQITTGTSKATFSPGDPCTRAQVVTFLWRSAGKPEPVGTENPFLDVTEDAYYYKAVLWAVENKITVGTSKTEFSPNSPCTRGQVVTFLYRFEGSPALDSTEHSFTDIKDTGYYYKAVLWAVANNITTGTTKTTFAPDQTCTRGQIVTFLYRAMAK